MITMKNLSKVYRASEVETTALRAINLEVRKGEFVAVMGPSGCGKSTFLNIVGMLDNPSAGEYWFDGQNIAGYAESQLSELRKNAVGIWGVLFLTVTGSAPISAMLFNTPIVVGYGEGKGAPAAFLFATLVLVVFSVGYVAMSRKITTAGGFYSTPAGRKDLNYIGNVPLARFDGPPPALLKALGLE